MILNRRFSVAGLALLLAALLSGCQDDQPTTSVDQEARDRLPHLGKLPEVKRPPSDPKHDEFVAVKELILRRKGAEAIRALEEQPELIHWNHKQFGTMLMVSADCGRTEVAAYLLEHGADPNARSGNGVCPLFECFLGAGCPELPKNVDGPRERPPTVRDHLPVLDLLLAHGVDTTVTFSGYSTSAITGAIKIEPTDTALDIGEKMQRSKWSHSMDCTQILARLREHHDLPVDALLPLNATTLYQELRPADTP